MNKKTYEVRTLARKRNYLEKNSKKSKSIKRGEIWGKKKSKIAEN